MVLSVNRFFGRGPSVAAITIAAVIGGVVFIAGRVFNSWRENSPATDDHSRQLIRSLERSSAIRDCATIERQMVAALHPLRSIAERRQVVQEAMRFRFTQGEKNVEALKILAEIGARARNTTVTQAIRQANFMVDSKKFPEQFPRLALECLRQYSPTRSLRKVSEYLEQKRRAGEK